MKRAIQALPTIPKRVLIGGNLVPRGLPCQAIAVVKGDSKIVSIAAASIVAKVTRDKHMKNLSRIYPGYGWEKNFGYGVKEHKKAIELLGITPQHRCSFKPIHNMLC